jgi:serine/threonine-protein kinase
MLPVDIKVGDTLGRYEILAPMAQGGMAAVWAARLLGTHGFQKLVAVKTMLPTLSDDADFEAMFLDEARLASRIRHPYVAEIIDLGEDEGWLYLVMEWVDGETIGTLNKRAKAKGGYPEPILARIVANACAGLHAAHELRDDKGNLLDLVHRDISPQNVMITYDGIVKLVDFGVAKAKGRAHETRVEGLMKGKVPYLSPEQLSGEKVDRRSDIFALGIIVYVMLSGRHPFRGENDQKTMENICSRAPVPLGRLVPTVAPEIEAVVMKALEKAPADRWQDCAEMQRAFEQFLNARGETVTDADLARYVRAELGDLLEARRAKLAAAIEAADARVGTRPDPKPNRPAALSRGTPLPATFSGILPVQLDDAPGPIAAPRAPAPPVAAAPFVPTSGHRGSPSSVPWPVVGAVLLALLGGAGLVALYDRMHAPPPPQRELPSPKP